MYIFRKYLLNVIIVKNAKLVRIKPDSIYIVELF